MQPGDPLKIPAETFNTFIDAAQDFKARTRGFAQKATAQAPQRTIIPVKNLSGADRYRFDVLEISQPLFDIDSDAGKERPMANGAKPGGPSAKIAVLLEPARVGEIARACVSGVTVARVKLKETWHKWVDLKKDECEYLESRAEPGGGYILWSSGQVGTQLVLLKISNPPPVHFPAKITSVTWETGGRYKYTFVEVEKKAKEWDGWKEKKEEDGGRSGIAFNLIETVNDDACMPAKVNETVWMEEVHFTGEGGEEQIEYWFQYEEYEDDGSDSSGDSSGSSSGGGEHIDVVICDPWNRCGNYLVFPQRRLHLPPGTTIETLPDTVVPIYQCQSSGDQPSSSGDSQPPDSDAQSSDFSWELYSQQLIVSGDIIPAEATGLYDYMGYFGGKPFWGKAGSTYRLYWVASISQWYIYGGDPGNHWNKSGGSPIGSYSPGSNATGTAEVSVAP